MLWEVFPDSLVFSINGRHTLTYPRLPQKEEEGSRPRATSSAG